MQDRKEIEKLRQALADEREKGKKQREHSYQNEMNIGDRLKQREKNQQQREKNFNERLERKAERKKHTHERNAAKKQRAQQIDEEKNRTFPPDELAERQKARESAIAREAEQRRQDALSREFDRLQADFGRKQRANDSRESRRDNKILGVSEKLSSQIQDQFTAEKMKLNAEKERDIRSDNKRRQGQEEIKAGKSEDKKEPMKEPLKEAPNQQSGPKPQEPRPQEPRPQEPRPQESKQPNAKWIVNISAEKLMHDYKIFMFDPKTNPKQTIKPSNENISKHTTQGGKDKVVMKFENPEQAEQFREFVQNKHGHGVKFQTKQQVQDLARVRQEGLR